MNTVLEIIKITVPALIVFLTVYVLMKYHYMKVYTMEKMKLKNENSNRTLPLRLQAYERLALFCERISPENMLLRFRKDATTGKELEQLLILAVKQEFDHNLTQQIYVSESLWNIVNMCKNQIIELLARAGKAPDSSDISVYSEIVLSALDESNPVKTTLKAIRNEVEIYFN